jgi:ABC-type transport system involved in multi-copper enzyme maturation permease subunit
MRNDAKKLVKIISLSVFFLFIFVFAFINSFGLVFGVKIKNVNITDGETVTVSPFELTGKAKNAINLTLNGREISIDKQGNFYETLALLPGYNIVTIRAQDKFGNVDEKNYKLMY